MNANIAHYDRIIKSNAALERGRMIIEKHSKPKLKFSSPEYSEQLDKFYVIALDQFDNEHEFTITKKEVLLFITDFYKTTVDTFYGNVHDQYEDTRSPQLYLSENTDDVITDFLNNKKS